MDYRRHTWRSTRILWGRSSVHRHWGFLYSQGKEDKLGRTDQVAALLSAARRLTIHSSRRCFATRLNSGVGHRSMEMVAKILIIWICIFALGVFLRIFPTSPISRFLLSWNGPQPRNLEPMHQFSFRWLVYCFKWLFFVTAVFCVGWWLSPGLYQGEPVWVTALLAFCLPMFVLIALAGCGIFLVRTLWQLIFRRQWVFNPETGTFMPNKAFNLTAPDGASG